MSELPCPKKHRDRTNWRVWRETSEHSGDYIVVADSNWPISILSSSVSNKTRNPKLGSRESENPNPLLSRERITRKIGVLIELGFLD